MKYQVISMLKVRTRTGLIRELETGEVITLSEGMAAPLLDQGRIKAIVPYLDQAGDDLIIPFNSDARFHWWNGGQPISETEDEIKGWLH